MTKIKFILAILISLSGVSSFNLLYGQPEVKLLKIEIVPNEAFVGDSLEASFSLMLAQDLKKDCFLFLHLEGFGPGRFVNADIVLSQPTSSWKPNQRIELGPFPVFIPLDLPEGDYRVTMGLAYPESTSLGIRYIKIPYSNPEIRNWTVGRVKVISRKSPLGYRERDYTLTVETSLQRIFPEKEYFETKSKNEISISSAKNEFEGFQVVIIPGNIGLKDVRVEISDLINEEDNTFIKKENISLYQVGFVKTKKPYYNTPKVGPWPDPLIPLKESITVNKKTIQPIWVEIYVPLDTPKGDYYGRIFIRPNGFKTKEIKLSLRVWNFSLPKESHLKTGFDFYEYLIDWRHPKKKDESDSEYKKRLEQLKKAYYLDMLRHRINPIHNVGNPKFLGKKDGRYILDFEEFDKKVEFYEEYGQACFGIAQEWPYGYKGEWTDKWYGFTDAEAVVGVFREYGRHLEQKGWLDKAYAYIFDETFHRVKEITGLIHKGYPGIKNLLTMTPEGGYPVDIWCVRINNLERPIVEEFRKKGKIIWTYVAGHGRPYPSLNLDLPSIEYRIIPWICWKYNVEGLLYWCVNWWHNTNPWDDPMTFSEQNGSGSLYYPDPQGREPVGSIRLKVLRDGFEDYEYLYLLQERLRKLKDNPSGKEGLIKEIEGALSQVSELIPSAAYFTRHPDKVNALRDNVARLIERTYE